MREAFPPDDATEVMKVTVPLEERNDIIRWTHTRDGKISVQSAYQYIKCSQTEPTAGNQQKVPSLRDLWQAIWAAKVWPKVQTYTWRFLSNSIAVRANLVRRSVQASQLCSSCDGLETIEHMTLGCEWTR